MLSALVGAGWDLFAPAPSTNMLVISLVLAAAAYVLLRVAEVRAAPDRPEAAGTSGALRRESPAVVNLLTNDVTVTAAGFRATVIDLGARGWLRLLPPADEDDDLGRVRPAATAHQGDALLPHERLVLQHVMARFTTDEAIPARFLAVDVRGSWWRRFRTLVIEDALGAGLIRRRWSARDLAPSAGTLLLAALAWISARSNGDTTIAVVDSIERRGWSIVSLIAIVALAVRIGRHAFGREMTFTELGEQAARRWLAVRKRLASGGFGRMAASAVELGDRRLGYASAMCLAHGAALEFPLAREDHYRAWSSVGATPRLVRIRYPARLGYGMHPLSALLVGIAATFGGLWLRRFASDVAREQRLDSLFERFPDQAWLITDVATGLVVVSILPIVGGLVVALAGAADMFATVERTGVVLRARRPAEVAPLPRFIRRRIERDRYSVYVAIDDGTAGELTAWRAGERNAVPQGASAIVRATPVLGHVRSAEPIGHNLEY